MFGFVINEVIVVEYYIGNFFLVIDCLCFLWFDSIVCFINCYLVEKFICDIYLFVCNLFGRECNLFFNEIIEIKELICDKKFC